MSHLSLYFFIILTATQLCVNAAPLCVGTENYTIITNYSWDLRDEGTFRPGQDNDDPGFTPLLCVSHTNEYVLWKVHHLLSAELENLFRTRNFTDILASLKRNSSSPNIGLFSYNRSSVTDLMNTPNGRDAVTVTVNAERGATLISCFSGFQPSPDWFIGFSSFNVCRKNETSRRFEWLLKHDFGIIPYDGGFDKQSQIQLEPEPEIPRNGVLQKVDILNEIGRISIINSKRYKPAPSAEPRACFPAFAKVIRADDSVIRMDQIVVGDKLRVYQDFTSPVFAFSHREKKAVSRFRRLHIADNLTLTASPGHYVYRFNGALELVAMDELVVGDKIQAADGSPLRVLRTSWIWENGLYNPHTLSGHLIVDGVRVSAFTRAMKPEAAHSALSPLRALHACGLGYWNEVVSSVLPR